MRLLRQVGRLEAAMAKEAEPGPVGIAWTATESRVDAAGLAIGEYIALDVCIVDHIGEVPLWHTRERVTRESCDLGWVYRGDFKGEAVGRVVSVDGQLVEWREENEEAAAP